MAYGQNTLMHPCQLTSHAKTHCVSLTGRLSPRESVGLLGKEFVSSHHRAIRSPTCTLPRPSCSSSIILPALCHTTLPHVGQHGEIKELGP